ncbi:hypothetical protein EXN32_01225 [Agrobacterium tumefaciens]|nr:hypothetical protein EXN32_01225 [Agrobacterium tumefaciens]
MPRAGVEGQVSLIPVLVTGIQPTRVRAAGRTPFSPRTWAGWIPVTGTGMREDRWCGRDACLNPAPNRVKAHKARRDNR